MTKEQGYKSQHYNPVVYLRQFRTPKTNRDLWEYDLSSGTVKKFEMQACQGSALLLLLQAVEDAARIFAAMKWSFLRAPADSFFYTSDKPVCCWLPAEKRSIFGAAITDRDIEITFPLSRKVCAFGCWESPYPQSYHSASPEIVDSFNQTTVMNGWRFVYGPANDLKVLRAVQAIAEIRSRRLPVEERNEPLK